MIAAAVSFLLSNWRLIVVGLLVAALGVQTVRLSWAHEEIAASDRARLQALADAQEKADRLANELIVAQAAAMAVTEKKVVTYVDRIRTVQAPDTVCAADERMRLGSRGVRDIVRGSDADPERGAPAAVQRPGAGARP